jgi:acetyl esterase
MQGVLARMHRAQQAPLHALTPQEARAAYENASGILDVPKPEVPRVHDLHIPARDDHLIRARLYAPEHPANNALPVLVYFHGGGFTIGSINTHDTLCRNLCLNTPCAVVSVDYRLAPEHKFPTAAHDAWDAMQWVHLHADTLGIDATRIAVGGDSAGGTLAAVCAIWARDENLPLRLQLLLYPGTTGHQDTKSHQTFAKGYVLEDTHITYFFNHYLNTPEDRHDWRFAPLYAQDTDGVAPAWIGLAECDSLVDEGIAYADKLRLSGVPVDLEIYRGVVHEFIKMGRAIPEALHAQRDAAASLRRAFYA